MTMEQTNDALASLQVQDGLFVTVRVIKLRRVYGREMAEISPVEGSGTALVYASRLTEVVTAA